MTLDRWLRRRKMSEATFAALVDDTCTQSLVSKWRRGVVMPSMPRQLAIQQVTLGEVSLRAMARKVKRTKADIARRAPDAL